MTAKLRPRRGEVLSPREQQVLAMVADGQPNHQIGAAIGIAENTVKTHLRRIYRELGARDRAHAVAIAIRGGHIR